MTTHVFDYDNFMSFWRGYFLYGGGIYYLDNSYLGGQHYLDNNYRGVSFIWGYLLDVTPAPMEARPLAPSLDTDTLTSDLPP